MFNSLLDSELFSCGLGFLLFYCFITCLLSGEHYYQLGLLLLFDVSDGLQDIIGL